MKNIFIFSSIYLLIIGNTFFNNHNNYMAYNGKSKSITVSNFEKPKTIKLKITGMTCAGCSSHIANTLKAMAGIIDQSVLYPGDLAIITYDSAKTNPKAIIEVIQQLGYKVEIINKTKK